VIALKREYTLSPAYEDHRACFASNYAIAKIIFSSIYIREDKINLKLRLKETYIESTVKIMIQLRKSESLCKNTLKRKS